MIAQIEPPVIEELEAEKINARIAELKRLQGLLRKERWEREYEIGRLQRQQDTATRAIGIAEDEIAQLQETLQTAIVL